MKFVKLDRRFRELTEKEVEDPALLTFWGDRDPPFAADWDALLKSRRVVLLAEAGSGKTRELVAQAEAMSESGKAAFFVPIEALDGEDLRNILAMEPGEAERFDEWQAGDEDGWFFLDAVDELKLRQGKLDTALGRLVKGLGKTRDRARLILSCRPTDWRPIEDLAIIDRRFPALPKRESVSKRDADEVFLENIRERHRKVDEKEDAGDNARIVMLLPLNERQIRLFATELGVEDVSGFLEEIDRHDAWSFASRPYDLADLAAVWKQDGRLGTRLRQHALNVEQSLREDPDRPDVGVLSPERARDGAERLALALLLTQTRTIRAPEQAVDEDRDTTSLNASEVLRDWHDAEVRALLRRRLFDPATYGRIRFHHRSVQEFLAAERLKKLRTAGMTARQLDRLLFADTYGERVLVPSLRPVAAWLAITDGAVVNGVLSREPEVLVLQGDPESLPPDARTRLLQSYVDTYGGGDWRGLEMPTAEVRRLAKPDLASEIRKLWEVPHSNEEVREFLLKVIWLGAICECVDIAVEAANDTKLGVSARTLAIRAIAECKGADALEAIAKDFFDTPSNWPDKVIFYTGDDFYPDVLTFPELETLIRRTPEPSGATGGFGWLLYTLANSLPLSSPALSELRIGLTSLLWDGLPTGSEWYRPRTKYEHLSGAVVRLALRELDAGSCDPAVVASAVAGRRLHGDDVLGSDEREALLRHFQPGSALRPVGLMAELDAMRRLSPSMPANQALFHAHDGLSGNLVADDWGWIINLLREERDVFRREAFLHAAIIAWVSRGRVPEELELLTSVVADDTPLAAVLVAETTPRVPNPEYLKMLAQQEKYRIEEKKREEERDRSWLEWKAGVQADPISAFSGEKKDASVNTLVQWMGFTPRNLSSSLALSGWREVRAVLGEVVGDQFERALREFWREKKPPIWSKRPADERNIITGYTTIALTALASESATGPGWTSKLSDEEAERAAEWATLEINGLPEWFPELASTHPNSVGKVLVRELTAELAEAETLEFPHIVNALDRSPDGVMQLVTPFLKEKLLSWPKASLSNAATWTRTLDGLIGLVRTAGLADAEVADLCETRFIENPRADGALTWLKGLASIDMPRAARVIRSVAHGLSPMLRAEIGASWFAGLFGNRTPFSHAVPFVRDAALLLDLTRLGYELVERESDIQREGVFSPGMRDDAQMARNNLLGALLGLGGREAHDTVVAMSTEPLFAHMGDRLRMQARQMAAGDSDPQAMSAAAFRAWEQRFDTPPSTRDELYQVMLDRLDDIDYDLQNHDFSERDALATITVEKHLQPIFASKLDAVSRDAYRVTREEEVADQKKPDVRLVGVAFPGRAAIEIKIGDNWTVTDLEAALSNQVVGQYLRHQNCSVGVLLITYAGRKGFEDPVTGSLISFEDVISRLRDQARSLEEENNGRYKVDVVAIDLRRPKDRP